MNKATYDVWLGVVLLTVCSFVLLPTALADEAPDGTAAADDSSEENGSLDSEGSLKGEDAKIEFESASPTDKSTIESSSIDEADEAAADGQESDDRADTAGPASEGETSSKEEAEAGPSKPWNERLSWPTWLFASESYRFRQASLDGELTTPDEGTSDTPESESDHSLRFFLEGGSRHPSDRFGLELSMGLWWDLTGPPSGQSTALATQFDVPQPWFDVFNLSADYRADGPIKLIRFGRQLSSYGLPVTFDGLSVFSRIRPDLELFLFGGRSVHFFEIGADLFEDWLASAGAVYRPSDHLRLELDYRFQREAVLNRDRSSRDTILNNSYGLTAYYRRSSAMMAKAYIRGVDAVLSHAGLATRALWEEADAGLDLSFDSQLVTLNEINERDDAFYVILGESLPFLRVHADLWKELNTDAAQLGVHGGFIGRKVISDEESFFNRSMAKGYVRLDATDIGAKGPYFSFGLEANLAPESDDLSSSLFLTSIRTIGYARGRVKAEVGSYFQQFKYDYYVDLSEVESANTLYGLLSVKLTPRLRLRARYEIERSDRDVQTGTLTVSQIY